MQSRTSQLNRSAVLWISGICLFYLGFEIFYNYYAILSVDEFWFAHNIYQFKDNLPYRDFAPYKTVLGYYLLLPALLAKTGILDPLIFVKNVLAVVNAVIFLVSAVFITRYFSKRSIIASLLVMLSSEVVLDYSTNLRVDLLGYWFGFFALLTLLENRVLVSGVLMGLGFAVTQKVIWYIIAADCAVGFYWLLHQRDWQNFKAICLFNISIIMTILSYLVLWGIVVNWNVVIDSVFREAAIMYQLDWYDSARLLFWKALTLHNPLLLFLWPLTFLSLVISYDKDQFYKQRFLIVVFSLTIFVMLIPYKQIFPYYLQVAIPPLFLLFSAFFSWLGAIFANPPRLLISRPSLYILLGCYVLNIIWFSVLFELPYAYLLICIVPFLLGNYFYHGPHCKNELSSLIFKLICVVIVIVNGIFPLMLFCIRMVDMNGGYQKANLAMMHELVADGSDYIAGIELIYNKTQPISGMRHLMGPAIDYLYHPTLKLRQVMLPSLNEDPNATIDSVLTALANSTIKFYVNNYRMVELPPRIKDFLTNDYEHYFGSIYLYAPLVTDRIQARQIKFSGRYKIEAASDDLIQLNGKTYSANQVITLEKGLYQSVSAHPYRLKLLPDTSLYLQDLDYQADRWGKMLY